MEKKEIKKYLPHREPFLFIDKVVHLNLEENIHAQKFISADEYFFKGHFPNNPIMPGVIIIEALAQASGILGFKTMNKTPQEGSIYVFAGVENAKFRARVRPGDVLDLYSEILNKKRGIWKFRCKASVNDKVVCSVDITCADTPA